MRIQLLYSADCPNAEAARENIRRALAGCGFRVRVEEIETTGTTARKRLRHWGSPTILVNGQDVAGATGPTGPSCRLYPGLHGAPSEEIIRAALHEARRLRWRSLRSVALVPGAILSLLPSATCPACVAAYAGVVSALGLGVLLTERSLVPLILSFLILGVVSVAWATKSHRRYGPLGMTIVGSLAVVSGRLVWNARPVLYIGAALLLVAATWNLWLKRARPVRLVQIGSGSVN